MNKPLTFALNKKDQNTSYQYLESVCRQTNYNSHVGRFFMSQSQRSDTKVNHSKVDNYDPKTRAMKSWKKRISLDEEPKIEKEKKPSPPKKEISSANKKFNKFCMVLITMSIGGGLFSMIGYSVGPQTCDNDSIFEILGVFAFCASMIGGIPVNLIIWLSSLNDSEFDSKSVFSMVVVHAVITLICLVVFGYYIFGDLWCGRGPNFYVTASPI